MGVGHCWHGDDSRLSTPFIDDQDISMNNRATRRVVRQAPAGSGAAFATCDEYRIVESNFHMVGVYDV